MGNAPGVEGCAIKGSVRPEIRARKKKEQQGKKIPCREGKRVSGAEKKKAKRQWSPEIKD